MPDAELHWTFVRFVRMWENNNFLWLKNSLSPYELAIISLFPHFGSIASSVFVFVLLDCIRSQQKGNTEWSPVDVQGTWLLCLNVHKGLAVLSPSNSWGVIFSSQPFVGSEGSSKYLAPASWVAWCSVSSQSLPSLSGVFSHDSQVCTLRLCWLTTPQASFLGTQPVRSDRALLRRASPLGLLLCSPRLQILNNFLFGFVLCIEVGRTMEGAPGQRDLTPTFLPPAASPSPWVGFSAICHRFFGSPGLVVPATLCSPNQG